MKLRRWITGRWGSATEAIYKIWKKKYELLFCDCNILKKPKIISKKRWIKIPIASSKNYLLKLNKILSSLKIDLLIPSVDEEVEIISKNRNKIRLKNSKIESVMSLIIYSDPVISASSKFWKT